MDGILIVAKPVGPTSHDVVALVRRLAATKRVGHGGTLDPFAGGVLPLFLGRATRMLEYHLGDVKRYRATVCFGATSTTDDLEGEMTPVGSVPDREAVEAGLAAFRGAIEQVPPAYSAIKVAGRRAYALARAGETPELKARSVTIHELTLLEWDASDPDRPIAIVDVVCSAGTYIRALARDLGAALGSGAYLGALSRTATGPFALEAAYPLETLRDAAAEGRLEALLLPADAGLEALPAIRLDAAGLAAIRRGQPVAPPSPTAAGGDDAPIRLLEPDGRLAAMARLRGGRLWPEKVLGAEEGPVAARVPTPEQLAERDPSPSLDPDPASPDEA